MCALGLKEKNFREKCEIIRVSLPFKRSKFPLFLFSVFSELTEQNKRKRFKIVEDYRQDVGT